MIIELIIILILSALVIIPFIQGFIAARAKSPRHPEPAPASASQPEPDAIYEDPSRTVNIHIGDRIGTQVKDSYVQRSDITGGDKEDLINDTLRGMISLGFKKKYSEELLNKILQETEMGSAEDLIREALKRSIAK